MRILIITDSIPYPPISGGPLRIYNLLQRITRRHEVWLAALQEIPEAAEGIATMKELCNRVETAHIRQRHPIAHLPSLFRYALTGTPLELKFKYSEELAYKIRNLVSSIDFDIVQIEHSHLALYLEALPTSEYTKSILMFHDVDFSKYERISHFEWKLSRKIRALIYSWMMRRWEPRYAERFSRCITVSEVDRDMLLTANPRLRIDVVVNGVDTKRYQPLPTNGSAPTLIFVGNMSYLPCADAVLYFCQEILPRIKQNIGDVEMWIVGKDPPPEVKNLNGDGVHVTGWVDSLIPYYNRSSVCVVPIRAGSGTRLKILEAMALGRPVVSTNIGCEGLNVNNGEHLLIADSPEQFAQDTIRLLTNKPLLHHITTNARQLVENQYDWDVIANQLMRIYADVAE